jgi:hypothetical protein
MELSKTKQNEANKLGVPLQYLIMADLMALGYTEDDAHTLAYPENALLSEQKKKTVITGIIETAKFRKLLDTRRARIKDGTAAPILLDEVELADTEEVLKEVLRSAKQQPVGSKERADLFARYHEIKTKNEQGSEDETDYINFVLPLKCNQCPLLSAYNDFLKQEGKKELRPDEMMHVMRNAHVVVDAARKAHTL